MPETPTKILVVSDIHGRTRELRWVLNHETDVTCLFALGDCLSDLANAFAQDGRPPYPVYAVRGNCDVGAPDPKEGLAPVDGVLFFYTHGHLYGVKYDYDILAEAADARGADVALFGHTHHRALVNEHNPRLPTLFNPGSLHDSGSYGVITVTDGKCSFAWRNTNA